MMCEIYLFIHFILQVEATLFWFASHEKDAVAKPPF